VSTSFLSLYIKSSCRSVLCAESWSKLRGSRRPVILQLDLELCSNQHLHFSRQTRWFLANTAAMSGKYPSGVSHMTIADLHWPDPLPAELKASYTVIIDEILRASDLNTISAKRIRKGLQERIGVDTSHQKARRSRICDPIALLTPA
jgi:hypothetical protein